MRGRLVWWVWVRRPTARGGGAGVKPPRAKAGAAFRRGGLSDEAKRGASVTGRACEPHRGREAADLLAWGCVERACERGGGRWERVSSRWERRAVPARWLEWWGGLRGLGWVWWAVGFVARCRRRSSCELASWLLLAGTVPIREAAGFRREAAEPRSGYQRRDFRISTCSSVIHVPLW